MKKLKIDMPIIVEGRYDKSSLSGYVDATVITTGGFSIFNNKEKQALIRRLSSRGVIVLTDSDGGGKQIRSFISSIVPKERIHHVFAPEIYGKESRKARPSKAGKLGVEGIDSEIILRLLRPFATDSIDVEDRRMITKVDFFNDKLSGHANSSKLRSALCLMLDLPHDMTANALLEALNLLVGYDEYKRLVGELCEQKTEETDRV